MEEGAGVEPARLFARRVSTALPSPIGWPFRMESHAGFAPTAVCFADIRLTARPVRHVGDVPESNRRRLDHSQVSSPLDEHPHVSCGGRVRTFELRFQRPAFVPAQTTPHRMAPPRGLKPRAVRLEDACAVHLRHGGEWCIWRDSNSHCAGSKPAASTNWATDALVR